MKRKNSKKRVVQCLLAAALMLTAGLLLWQTAASDRRENGKSEHPAVEDQRDTVRLREEFDAWIDKIAETLVTSDSLTFNATLAAPETYGICMEKVTLGEYSLSGFQEGILRDENWLSALEQFDYERLTQEEQLEYDILHNMLQAELRSADVLEYMECLGPTTGIQAQLPLLLAEYHFRDSEDVEVYLALLKQLPEYFAQIIAFEQMKSEKHIFMSDTTCEAILKQCREFISEPDQNYLISSFEEGVKGVSGLSEKERKRAVQRNRKAVAAYVIPAYQSLIEALEECRGTGNNRGGLCKLPQGKAYYEYLLASMTGSSRSVGEIDEMLEEALQSSQQKMSQILTKTPDAYYDAEDAVYPCEDPVETVTYLKEHITVDFAALPEKVDCDVKYVDESLEDSLSPALYLTSPVDDYCENVVYLNQSEAYDLTECFATIAHESYPGHLYQNAYFLSQEPSLLRRIVSNGGYVEGWGTYAEKYSYSLAGMNQEAGTLRAENLVATLCLYARADLQVNYYGWNRKKLSTWLKEYGFGASQSRLIYDAVVAEPVSYMQYTLGYLEIQSLLERAREQLGDRFSLRAFHGFYLGIGSVPFSVLQDRLEQWMTEQQNTKE